MSSWRQASTLQDEIIPEFQTGWLSCFSRGSLLKPPAPLWEDERGMANRKNMNSKEARTMTPANATNAPGAPTRSKETKARQCQACGESYEYPLPGSPATRFHCDNCAGLPERARKAMGRMMTRIRALEKAIGKQGAI
jgi:hypothetical protein